MSRVTRRAFLEDSMLAAAAAATLSAAAPKANAAISGPVSANETIHHAIIGCRIRGRQHAQEFAKVPGVEITCVCDPDSELVEALAAAVEKQQGRRPKAVQDLRHIFDDPSVDTVSIAAPNHWHTLAAMWAMQAGKDVYVEKPVSHNIVEGRRLVEAANLTKRICQAGTQNRSRGDLAAAAQYIKEGKLGEVTFARSIMYRKREPIGAPGVYPPPSNVDFNLWLGPATHEVITRPSFHYDWHWFWDTGNGEIGNNNIHVIDKCRLLTGLTGMGDSVCSIGTRTWDDAGETPNTQMVVHTFGPVTVIQETRNLESSPFSANVKEGCVVYGTNGFIADNTLFDLEGNKVKTFDGPSQNHFANFIDAVRSRRGQDLKADITEGDQSTSLCNAGNVSYRLGQKASAKEIRTALEGMSLHANVMETYERTLEHLRENNVDLGKTPLHNGPLLKIDPKTQMFPGNKEANALRKREYREPFVLPKIS